MHGLSLYVSKGRVRRRMYLDRPCQRRGDVGSCSASNVMMNASDGTDAETRCANGSGKAHVHVYLGVGSIARRQTTG